MTRLIVGKKHSMKEQPMQILTEAQPHQETGRTEVTFESNEAIRHENLVLWSMSAATDDKRLRDHRDVPAAQFVFDYCASRQINLPIAATLHKSNKCVEGEGS